LGSFDLSATRDGEPHRAATSVEAPPLQAWSRSRTAPPMRF